MGDIEYIEVRVGYPPYFQRARWGVSRDLIEECRILPAAMESVTESIARSTAKKFDSTIRGAAQIVLSHEGKVLAKFVARRKLPDVPFAVGETEEVVTPTLNYTGLEGELIIERVEE